MYKSRAIWKPHDRRHLMLLINAHLAQKMKPRVWVTENIADKQGSRSIIFSKYMYFWLFKTDSWLSHNNTSTNMTSQNILQSVWSFCPTLFVICIFTSVRKDYVIHLRKSSEFLSIALSTCVCAYTLFFNLDLSCFSVKVSYCYFVAPAQFSYLRATLSHSMQWSTAALLSSLALKSCLAPVTTSTYLALMHS